MLDERESRALLELIAHLAQGEEERRRSPRVLSPVEDLPGHLVRAHGLGALAFRAGYDDFRDDFTSNAVDAQVAEKAVADAVAKLSSAEIPVILLDASSYIHAVYGDAAELSGGDHRLLVPATAMRRASGLLAASPDGVRPLLVDVVQREGNIPTASLWARALPAIEREDGAQRLNPVDEALLHLHAIAGDGLVAPCVRYVEAARLLRRRGCDRRRVLDRAQELRVQRAIRAAIALTDSFASAATATAWPDRRMRVLPNPIEVLSLTRPRRPLQLLRKAALVERPREIAHVLRVGLFDRRGTR